MSNAYTLCLEAAALHAKELNRPVYVVRYGGDWCVETSFTAGLPCVEVMPNGQTREIAGPKPRASIRVGAWTGD